MLTTQAQIRAAFWRDHPQLTRVMIPIPWEYRRGYMGGPGVAVASNKFRAATQNDYPTDTRCAFVDYVDMLARDGQISEALAARVTL